MSDGQNDETAEQAWKRHNKNFQYDWPDSDPESWDREQYEGLYDRLIGREVIWTCDHCSMPFDSLKRARSHVGDKHGDYLLKKARAKAEGE